MVEKMKKIHLLMASDDSADILADLQNLGVVHIDTGTVSDDSGIIQLGSRITALKKVNADLKPYSDHKRFVMNTLFPWNNLS